MGVQSHSFTHISARLLDVYCSTCELCKDIQAFVKIMGVHLYTHVPISLRLWPAWPHVVHSMLRYPTPLQSPWTRFASVAGLGGPTSRSIELGSRQAAKFGGSVTMARLRRSTKETTTYHARSGLTCDLQAPDWLMW
jgi:hypothetical protein